MHSYDSELAELCIKVHRNNVKDKLDNYDSNHHKNESNFNNRLAPTSIYAHRQHKSSALLEIDGNSANKCEYNLTDILSQNSKNNKH